jgi:hypothetical protein
MDKDKNTKIFLSDLVFLVVVVAVCRCAANLEFEDYSLDF